MQMFLIAYAALRNQRFNIFYFINVFILNFPNLYSSNNERHVKVYHLARVPSFDRNISDALNPAATRVQVSDSCVLVCLEEVLFKSESSNPIGY